MSIFLELVIFIASGFTVWNHLIIIIKFSFLLCFFSFIFIIPNMK